VSVPSNIVEGCARHAEADYLHLLDIAYASSREVEYRSRSGLATWSPSHPVTLLLCVETSKVLAGLICALRR
jgi:four helix bundle protein